MRPTTWQYLLIGLTATLMATAPAEAKKKRKSKKPAASETSKGDDKGKVDEGEIEMEPTPTAPSSGETNPSAAPAGEIEIDAAPSQGNLEADVAALGDDKPAATSTNVRAQPLSWNDIRVVVRKPFLKSGRFEMLPTVSTTANDNMLRHIAFGGQLNYFLTDVLAVGLEGQYFIHQFREPFDLVARQVRRLPTVNEYNWSGALNFHYVPIYGKFAILGSKLVTWEAYLTAGIGAGQSSVLERDTKYPGFSTLLIQPNLGVTMRFFLTKWMTINFGVRDYIFIDKFEPTNRGPGNNDTASLAQENADSSFINHVMFQAGLSFWLPTSFEYTTFR